MSSTRPTLLRPTAARPQARGPLSAWLFAVLSGVGASPVPSCDHVIDPLTDDDLHLALHCCYELSYRGLRGVDAAWEDDPSVLELRRALEQRFEIALRAESAAASCGPGRTATEAVGRLLDQFEGPSLSGYILADGTREELCEFLVHRSAYQLKEADPHSWAIPRLPSGRRKSAFIEIQADEYGEGEPGRSHAELFARALEAAGLDHRYGAYVDRLPGVTLATGNLVSMFGMHRRLTAALVGHLAVFEMTSVVPMGRYALACDRLGFGPAVRAFYDVHVEADEHHGRLARDVLLGGDVEADGLDSDELVFGASALLRVEDRFARHLLDSWARGESSLRPERERPSHAA